MKELIAIQKELNVPKNQRNKFGNYNYRSCEDILVALKPLLDKHQSSILITDEVKEVGGIPYVEATVVFKGKETEALSVRAQAGINPNRKGMDIAQSFGSSSSYARKYALAGMFLLDDTKDADTMDNSKTGVLIMSNKELIQGSDEWFKVRMGKITASKLSDLMKKTKYGESTYKTRLRMELAIERLTGKSASPNFMNQAMHDGVEREPDARTLFEAITGKEVALCGSFDHPEIVNTSASPDGLIRGEDAVLEIKCPTHVTHAKNLLSETMPKNYEYQLQWQIACTESEYGYFCSYHPDFPPELRLKWVKVLRDNMMILDIEEAVREFDAEVEDLITKIKKGANKNG